MRENHRKGFPTGPDLLAAVGLVEQAAADYQRRQQPVSAGTSVLVRPSSASPRSDWVNVGYAALALGVTERQVRNLCHSGKLRATQDSRHQWCIDPASIENHRARREYGQGEQQGSDSG